MSILHCLLHKPRWPKKKKIYFSAIISGDGGDYCFALHANTSFTLSLL